MRYTTRKPLIVETLREHPSSSMVELAQYTGMTRNACAHYIRQMYDADPQEVHISAWDRVVGRGRHTPRYSLGASADAAYPAPLSARERTTAYKDRERARVQSRTLKARESQVLELLERGTAMTIAQMSAALGVSDYTVARAVKVLRSSPKYIHIEDWLETRDQRTVWVALHAAGDGADAPKPPPLTGAEQSRLFRKRHGARIYLQRAVARGKATASAADNPFYSLVTFAIAPHHKIARAQKKVETRGRPKKTKTVLP